MIFAKKNHAQCPTHIKNSINIIMCFCFINILGIVCTKMSMVFSLVVGPWLLGVFSLCFSVLLISQFFVTLGQLPTDMDVDRCQTHWVAELCPVK